MNVFFAPLCLLAATLAFDPFSLTTLWLVAGALLCCMELFVPTAFVELAMGISAFFVAIASLILPDFGLQVLLWMVFSLVLVFLTRRLLPKRKHYTIQEATEAKALTEIAPGQTGRAIFEGNSWQARCEGDRTILPAQKAIVIGREGTTLIVIPESSDL